MAGMFLAGSTVFAQLRHGDDARRRRRHRRLAHGAAGDARAGSATAWSAGRVPVIAERRERGESRCGAHPRSRAAPPRRLAGAGAALLIALGAARHRDAYRRPRLHRPAAGPPDHADVQPHPGRLPGRAGAGDRRGRRRPTSRAPAVQAAIARMTSRAIADRDMSGPVATRDEPRPDGRGRGHPDRRQRHRQALRARARRLRERVIPATVGRGARAHAPRSTASPPARRTSTTSCGRTCRSCSGSCSGSRSCCCCSRSARSSSRSPRSLLNLLSVGAAYGDPELVFQHGRLQSLLASPTSAASSTGCRCSCS